MSAHKKQSDMYDTLDKKATIHQLTTMLTTSKNVLFPGYNHLLTTGADDPSLAGDRVKTNVSGHQHRWLTGGYDLEIGHFEWWIVALLRSDSCEANDNEHYMHKVQELERQTLGIFHNIAILNVNQGLFVVHLACW